MSEPDAGTDAKARTWGAGDYSQIASRLVPVSERLCEAVDLRAGRTVLDVASGHGKTALAAARQGAVVKAIDITEPLLEQGGDTWRWTARSSSRSERRSPSTRVEVLSWRVLASLDPPGPDGPGPNSAPPEDCWDVDRP